ncbi:hypothetical protein L1D31_15805 [Vibrio sp. Isolate23]|uniref:hypothetical protein n=1 Tax=Vibrio sp. Isolate23 TaxID=2908533 RepID=UPI001EFC94AB|nr:hypothetical protein [Vibrio sp. Isolate23]MCG9684025.1 hypothetical protein [Vibrio sp. Isolate23]
MCEKLQELVALTFRKNEGGAVIDLAYQNYIPKEWVNRNNLSVLIFIEGVSFGGDFFKRFNDIYSDDFFILKEPDYLNCYGFDLIDFNFKSYDEFYESQYFKYPKLLLNEFIVSDGKLRTIFHVSDDNIMIVFGDKSEIEGLFNKRIVDNKIDVLIYVNETGKSLKEADYYWGYDWKSKI